MEKTGPARLNNFRSGASCRKRPETAAFRQIPAEIRARVLPPCPPGNERKFPIFRFPLAALSQSVQIIVSSGATLQPRGTACAPANGEPFEAAFWEKAAI
jgi:hypothetical protein